jgi:hypothetical protein
MRKHFFLVLAGLALPAASAGIGVAGCGPSVETIGSTEGGGGGFDAGPDGHFPVGHGGFDAGHDALPDYVDPGCPDAGPPLTMFECDPYNQHNGDCAPEDGCFIFVQYPTEPCGQETYGAVCALAGSGKQGAGCDGAQNCAGGFVCVVSGSGNQCVQLCELTGNDGCPPGLVCEPIDVQGFGGCL